MLFICVLKKCWALFNFFPRLIRIFSLDLCCNMPRLMEKYVNITFIGDNDYILIISFITNNYFLKNASTSCDSCKGTLTRKSIEPTPQKLSCMRSIFWTTLRARKIRLSCQILYFRNSWTLRENSTNNMQPIFIEASIYFDFVVDIYVTVWSSVPILYINHGLTGQFWIEFCSNLFLKFSD